MLQVLGIGPADEELYEQLVDGLPLSAAELAVSRHCLDEVSERLARLHALGLVTQVPGPVVRWAATPPGAALELLISDRSRALAEASVQVAGLEARFQRAAARRGTPHLVEAIYGRDAIVERFDELQRTVRYEIRSCDAPPYPQANPSAVNDLEIEHLKRGIRYRVLYDRRAIDVPGRLTDLEVGILAGEQARVSDVPIKMTMADHSIAILPLRQPADVESRLIVYDQVLLDALAALFDIYWERALPLRVSNGRAQLTGNDREPSADDTHLLPLLIAGLTDQEITAQLSLSDRTVRSRVHAMMTRLDATTRFQAGYQVVTRGWLDTDELTQDVR